MCQTKSDFLEPTNNNSSLCFCARKKERTTSTKRSRERCVAVVVLRRERSFSRVSERCFFSLPFCEGGVNRSKVFPSFLCFFLSLCFYLNPTINKP